MGLCLGMISGKRRALIENLVCTAHPTVEGEFWNDGILKKRLLRFNGIPVVREDVLITLD